MAKRGRKISPLRLGSVQKLMQDVLNGDNLSSVHSLFHGKLNLPQAAGRCGISADEMKRQLEDYVSITPLDDWELDIEPSWPYA
jgi:hypothetical protein